jgi:hypothetical protein
MINKKIYFKLIFDKGIYIHIPNYIKVNNINSFIKNHIIQRYGISEFNILEAGTEKKEYNDPIDENADIYFYDKYPNAYLQAFYISPKQTTFCCICQAERQNLINLNCQHRFCNLCINQWINTGHHTCPTCRRNI